MRTEFAQNLSGSLGTPVIIGRGVSSDPRRDFRIESYNSMGQFTAAYNRVGFSIGSPIIKGTLIINWMTKAEADALRDFFTNTIRFLAPFAITVFDSPTLDIGNGAGQQLLRCHFEEDVNSTEGIIIPAGKGNRFNLELNYTCLDKVWTGGAIPL